MFFCLFTMYDKRVYRQCSPPYFKLFAGLNLFNWNIFIKQCSERKQRGFIPTNPENIAKMPGQKLTQCDISYRDPHAPIYRCQSVNGLHYFDVVVFFPSHRWCRLRSNSADSDEINMLRSGSTRAVDNSVLFFFFVRHSLPFCIHSRSFLWEMALRGIMYQIPFREECERDKNTETSRREREREYLCVCGTQFFV